MAARVVGIRQEGVNPCRMVPSIRDEVHVQLHDVTGKVQRARLRIAVQRARGASCRAGCAYKFKKELIWNEKSKPRFRVNMISRGRGERSPVSGHRITSS